MTRAAYALLLAVLWPWLAVDALRRAWRAPPAHRRWFAQFGRLPAGLPTGGIWLHAVSLGEVRAAAPLVAGLRARWPMLSVVISTTTETGANAARALGVPHFYAPFDYAWAVRRVLRRLRPRVLLVMETELWPNWVAQAAAQSVPVAVVNARLSPRSFARYQRWGGSLLAETLSRVSLICAQSSADAARFTALAGAATVPVMACGNLKYDHDSATVPPWAKPLDRSVWLAASTHEGEERAVLAAHRAVLAAHPSALLILVPRHPERAASVLGLARAAGFSASMGGLESVPAGVGVWIIGQTGVLMPLFAALEAIFMGGSLGVTTGGHNPIEPGSLARAVLTGRGVHNFASVYAGLAAADAVVWVDDAASLATAVQACWDQPETAEARGARAATVIAAERGATAATLAQIARWLPPEVASMEVASIETTDSIQEQPS